MTKWTPEIEQQIEQKIHKCRTALIAAWSAKHVGKWGKLATHRVKPSEFDQEIRYWIEEASNDEVAKKPQIQQLQSDLQATERFNQLIEQGSAYYYTLTNLPPEHAMLLVTIDGDFIEMVFAPLVKPPATTKGKGFG